MWVCVNYVINNNLVLSCVKIVTLLCLREIVDFTRTHKSCELSFV